MWLQITAHLGEMSMESLRSTTKDFNLSEQVYGNIEKLCKVTNNDLTICDDGARLYRCIDNQILRHNTIHPTNRSHKYSPPKRGFISKMISTVLHLFNGNK